VRLQSEKSSKQFFATIEPFHGNMVVVYTQDSHGDYQRNVIDDSLVNGHTLSLVDVDGDGVPEIVASGSGTRNGLFFYRATDASGQRWKRMLMDNDMSAQGCVVTDIKGRGEAATSCASIREDRTPSSGMNTRADKSETSAGRAD